MKPSLTDGWAAFRGGWVPLESTRHCVHTQERGLWPVNKGDTQIARVRTWQY